MEGYETEVFSNLEINLQQPVQIDYTKWIIDGKNIKWIGNKEEQDFEKHLKKLVEDVFQNSQASVEIRGELKWQGEDDEDFGTIIVDGKNIHTHFRK